MTKPRQVSSNLVELAMPDGVPWTIRQLQELPIGDVLCYYRGNFDLDIPRALLHRQQEYAQLLSQIREMAAKPCFKTSTVSQPDRRGKVNPYVYHYYARRMSK